MQAAQTDDAIAIDRLRAALDAGSDACQRVIDKGEIRQEHKLAIGTFVGLVVTLAKSAGVEVSQ